MTDKVEQIRNEVKRLLNEPAPSHDSQCKWEDGYWCALYKIEEFIDSLQEEPVSEDLEEACEQLAENARKHKAETSSPFFSQTDYIQGVMDGTKWQKEQFEKDYTNLCNGIATIKGLAVAMVYDKGVADTKEQMMKNTNAYQLGCQESDEQKLRERYAGMALQGISSQESLKKAEPKRVAEVCVTLADALIAELRRDEL